MEKYEFTFVMITYNQEKYVVEQLESIKYQVNTYGKEYITYFLLCDDASTDRTVYIVKKWLEQNNVFHNVELCIAPHNRGLVQNYLYALKKIKTDHYKLLAGDDLYAQNSVYEVMRTSDLVVTPAIKLRDSIVLYDTPWKFKWLLKKKECRKALLRDVKCGHPIETPGVFWNHAFFDAGLSQILSNYKWIEDVPCYYYLLGNKKLKVSTRSNPYVIYRVGSGISTNANHLRSKEFHEEERKIKKEYCVWQYKYPKFAVLYIRVRRRLYTNILNYVDPQLRAFDTFFKRQVSSATEFYYDIHCRALNWLEENL